MGELRFSIDFDDTFSADPGLWAMFIRQARERGHRFVCFTCRRECEENLEEMGALFEHFGVLNMPIVFCNAGSKQWTADQKGIRVDIWIDDSPHAIVHGV